MLFRRFCSFALVVFTVACHASLFVLVEANDDEVWQKFKKKYGKDYDEGCSGNTGPKRKLERYRKPQPPTAEEMRRKEIFMKNYNLVKKHNANPNKRFTLKVYEFADKTQEEMEKTMMGEKEPPEDKQRKRERREVPSYHSLHRRTPESLDWRELGAVPPVKNQCLNNCGSCWAFAAASAIESRYFITTGKLLRFSEQIIGDCTSKNLCDGGWSTTAVWAIKQKLGGLNLESVFPYKGHRDECKFDSSIGAKYATNLQDHACTEFIGNDAAVIDALQSGPLIVSIFASEKFHDYRHGVFSDPEVCDREEHTNHAVVIVGYGTEANTGLPYWIVRNSWGEHWGERGYIRMQRGFNNCKILNHVRIVHMEPAHTPLSFFGGLYACRPGACVTNQVTGGSNCPRGTYDSIVSTAHSDVNNDTIKFHMCAAQRADPEHNFGGMYFRCDEGYPPSSNMFNAVNPLTGSFRCPAGYGSLQFRLLSPDGSKDGSGRIGCTQTVCFNHQTSAPIGGFFQRYQDGSSGPNSIPNPVTGDFTCPPGYSETRYGGSLAPESRYPRSSGCNYHKPVGQFYCRKNTG